MIKKIIAAILMLCLSGTLAVNAETAEPVGTPGTFKAMVTDAAVPAGKDNIIQYPHATKDAYLANGANALANEIAEQLKKLPEGYRAIYITSMTVGFWNAVDGFYNLEASEEVKERMESFAKALHTLGAEIDYIFDDYEYPITAGEFETQVMVKYWDQKKESVAETIANHSHKYEADIRELMIAYEQTDFYKEVLRPLLVERGFTFGQNYDLEYVNVSPKALGATNEKYYQTADALPEGAADAHQIFTEVVKKIQCDVYNECVLEPFKKYYPDIKISNYSYWIDSGEIPYTTMFNEVPVVNGIPVLDNIFGNGSSPVFYGTFYNWQNVPQKEYPYEKIKENSFNLLLQEWMQSIDIGHTSAKYNKHYAPWIMTKSSVFVEGSLYWHNFRETPYYEEAVTHFAMHGADPILYFVYAGSSSQDFADLSQTLHELDYMCGFEDRKPVFFDNSDINEMPKWDQRYVLSGMYAGGRNVWRITPDLYTPGVTVENFCIDRENPTFQIGNQFIEFPEGSKIIEPEGDTKEYGYWVTSPAGTKPKQYRDLSLPEPDQQVDLVDGEETPMGYAVEPVGNGVASKYYDFTVKNKPVKGDDNEVVDEPEYIKIAIKPISFNGKTTPLVTRDLPMDIAGHWSKDTMSHMYALGIIKGTDVGLEPDKELTKAEFLTMLFRALQVKSTTYEGGISDLRQGEWYADTVYTALNGGWITADASGKVNAEKPLSREDMAVIMMKAIGENEEAEQTIIHFTDEASISGDALSAVRQAVGLSVLKGNADGSFSPKKICTRAEAATMIENYFMTLR